MGGGVFVISYAPGKFAGRRLRISRKLMPGRFVIWEVALSIMCTNSASVRSIATVCVGIWANGIFCSVASLRFGVGVWLTAALADAEGVRSLGHLLLVGDV